MLSGSPKCRHVFYRSASYHRGWLFIVGLECAYFYWRILSTWSTRSQSSQGRARGTKRTSGLYDDLWRATISRSFTGKVVIGIHQIGHINTDRSAPTWFGAMSFPLKQSSQKRYRSSEQYYKQKPKRTITFHSTCTTSILLSW